MDSLCRVCSNPGSHSIFARIPAYCHEHYREYARWKQPICLLIAEVTGVEIKENDGLPKKICVLCISYLKHAYTFRRQALDNIAGLLTAKYLSDLRPESKKPLLDDHPVNQDRIISTCDGGVYRSVNLSEMANDRSAVKKPTKKAPVMHRFIEKPPDNNVEEDVDNLFDGLDEPSSGLFGYREKEFVEDDVMDLDGLQEHGVTFTLPEDYKEKKCFACRKRFMFSETYSQHLTECLMYKLTEAIRALYHIMYLREQSAISAFEFIRRAVFTVRKSYHLVLSYDGELDGEDIVGDTEENTNEIDESQLDAGSRSSSGELIPRHTFGGHELDSLNKSDPFATPKSKHLPEAYDSAGGMNNRTQPLVMVGSAFTHPVTQRPVSGTIATAMALHSNVDIIKNRLTKTGPEEVNESNANDRYKTIKCKQCEARFYTISHLDEHTIKVHQRRV